MDLRRFIVRWGPGGLQLLLLLLGFQIVPHERHLVFGFAGSGAVECRVVGVTTGLLESGRVAVCQEEGAQGHEYVVQQRRLAHETQSLDIVPVACAITSVPPTITHATPQQPTCGDESGKEAVDALLILHVGDEMGEEELVGLVQVEQQSW